MDYTFDLDSIWQLEGEPPILELGLEQDRCPSLEFSEESSTSFDDYSLLSDEHVLRFVGLEPLMPLDQYELKGARVPAREGMQGVQGVQGVQSVHGVQSMQSVQESPHLAFMGPHSAPPHPPVQHQPPPPPPPLVPAVQYAPPAHDWSPHRRSISKMPLAQLYHIMGLPHDHNRARDREERIMRILSDSGFEIGQKTWIRDTEESFRRKIIEKIWQSTREEYGYSKALLEAIVRRGTYARMQSNLRRRRRHMIRASRRNI